MFEKVLEFTFIWLPIAFIIGYSMELIYRKTKGKYKTFFSLLAIIGVAVHEAAHALLCLITGVPIKKMEVNYRNKTTGKISPHGFVRMKRPRKVTFMQSFLVCIAPLLIGVILFFYLLDVARDMSAEPLYRIIAGIMCVSLLFGVRPSSQDLRLILYHFQKNPAYSWFQLFLLIASFGLVWWLVDTFMITFPFEFVYYLFMGLVFFALKYICLLIRFLYMRICKHSDEYKEGTLYGEFEESRHPAIRFSGE